MSGLKDVVLRAEPHVPAKTWAAFCASAPAHAIALDGYVRGGPRFDPRGPRANFNHHEDVDRLATRATCAQVLMALRQGLLEAFRGPDGAPRAVVCVNDCDEDVCTAWFLLRHAHLVVGPMNPLVNRLVALEDALDTTAGAYPFPADLPALRELAWVYAPYRAFRARGGLDARDPGAFADVIGAVEARLLRHVTGSGEDLALDLRYAVLERHGAWSLIREDGAHARTAFFGDGGRAFVAVRERADGRYAYTVGRMSAFVPFDVPAILEALNAAEGGGADAWGGGDTVGGSPRVAGSRLGPDDVSRVVGEVVARTAGRRR